MGWDVTAQTEHDYNTESLYSIVDKDLQQQFLNASTSIEACDADLRFGGLHLTESRHCLRESTGQSVYVDSWSPDEVKEFYNNANWNVQFEDNIISGVKEFLRICSENNLGVKFSW